MTFTVLDFVAAAVALVMFAVLFFLDKKKNLDFSLLILLGTAFGILLGVLFTTHYNIVAMVGTIYSQALSAFVVPLLLFSVTASITNLSDSIRLKNIGLKSVLWLLFQTLSASVLTLIAAEIFNVGANFHYVPEAATKAREVPSVIDTIVGLFPSNLVAQWSTNAVVTVIVFAIIVALAYNSLVKDNPDVVYFKKFIDAGNKVMSGAIGIVIDFTPYAVTALIFRAVGANKISDMLPLLLVLVIAYALSAIQIFGVETLLIKFVAKLNPIQFLRKVAPAGVVAFTSESSIGTLPVTIRQLKEKMGVHEDIASFTASLGANLGMPGCAGMWPMLLAIFVVHMQKLNYTAGDYGLLIVLTLLVSIGTVGVPGTATITATALFTAAGLPIEMIVLFSPISMIVDMARTATNVIGAATATVLVAESENMIDHEVYNADNADQKGIAKANA